MNKLQHFIQSNTVFIIFIFTYNTTQRELNFGSWYTQKFQFKPNSAYNYPFSIVLTQNGSPSRAKLIRKG